MNPLVTLRPVRDEDLPAFFAHQQDPVANKMAAFTVPDPADHDAFEARWRRIRADERNINRTIEFNGEVVGSIACFPDENAYDVGYWLGREWWGKGIATEALRLFLIEVERRPLQSRVAVHNLGSQRVLTKCGFRVVGADIGFTQALQDDCEEYIYELS